MHQKICYFAMNFILAVKRPFKIQSGIFYERGGMKTVSKNIFLFFDPVARVLAHRNIEQ